jgi:hypothetical protein
MQLLMFTPHPESPRRRPREPAQPRGPLCPICGSESRSKVPLAVGKHVPYCASCEVGLGVSGQGANDEHGA